MMLVYFFVFLVFHSSLAVCPNGTITSFSNPNICYLFVKNGSAFITAEGYCREHGGHLTSVSNSFENLFLSQQAASLFGESTEANFWIGATKDLNPEQWSWLDGAPFDYISWEKGQPENTMTSNCGASSFTSSLWMAQDCFKVKPFVCKITAAPETTTSKPTTTTTTQRVPTCQSGWTAFDQTGFCYKAFTDMNTNWEDSEKHCVSNYGAHLASIHSQAESYFVGDLARAITVPNTNQYWENNQCWIGGYTWNNNRNWNWCDGTPFDFAAWSPGEPNKPGEENCLELMLTYADSYQVANFWNNGACGLIMKSFVCKKSKS